MREIKWETDISDLCPGGVGGDGGQGDTQGGSGGAGEGPIMNYNFTGIGSLTMNHQQVPHFHGVATHSRRNTHQWECPASG